MAGLLKTLFDKAFGSAPELTDVTYNGEKPSGIHVIRKVTWQSILNLFAANWQPEDQVVEVCLNGLLALTTNDKGYARIPEKLNGWDLIAVSVMVKGASSSGAVTITVKNGATSMLTTNPVVDAGEYDTLTGTAAVVDAAHDNVATGNQIEVAVSGAGTGVTYCVAELVFRKP